MILNNQNGSLVCYTEFGVRFLSLELVASVLGTTASNLKNNFLRYTTPSNGQFFVSEESLPGLLAAIPHNFTVAQVLNIELVAARWLRQLAAIGFRLDLWVTAGVLPGTDPGSVGFVLNTNSSSGIWVAVNAGFTPQANRNYICSGLNPLQVLLPTDAIVGFEFLVIAEFQTFYIQPQIGQTIRFGDQTVTTNLTALSIGDTLRLVCTQAPNNWMVYHSIGNISIN